MLVNGGHFSCKAALLSSLLQEITQDLFDKSRTGDFWTCHPVETFK